MKKFLGVFRYEYKMSIHRVGVWIIVLFFTALYIYMAIDSGQETYMNLTSLEELLSQAGQIVFSFNLFFPVLAGIVAADRAVRDRTLGVRELLLATGIPDLSYVLGKYLGVVLSLITFAAAVTIPMSLFVVIYYQLSAVFILYVLWATLLIIGPALLFVTAFSLVCPLIMPTRLYQILFTGYWYWGNFLSSNVMFTISNTLLNASGRYALIGIFGMKMADTWPDTHVSDALLNIIILIAYAGLALAGMLLVLRCSEQKAGH